jgi:hypothetical protein
MREADILTALAPGPLHLRGIADKTGSLNGLKEKLLELARRRCVCMRPTGREHRYTITSRGLRHLAKHTEDTAASWAQALTDIIQTLNLPTDQESKDYDRQLIDAVDTRNDKAIQRLAAHPAGIKIAGFSRVLEAAYSGFCKVHSLPAGIYVRVKEGKVEPLPEEYISYLKERAGIDPET